MIPSHIGLIMDGNGRWAVSHGLPRAAGYAEGVKALNMVAERFSERGIKALSVYAFSTENFARPKEEINAIFAAVESFNDGYDGNFRITYMGDFYSSDDALASSIERIEARTAGNDGMILNIALNYGGRADIIHAARVACDHGDFSEEAFEKRLGSAHLPPLDMIVRTGGEKRLSNFMLYEAAYAELMFIDKLWADVTKADADDIIKEFENRTRKFGA